MPGVILSLDQWMIFGDTDLGGAGRRDKGQVPWSPAVLSLDPLAQPMTRHPGWGGGSAATWLVTSQDSARQPGCVLSCLLLST